MKNFVSKQVGVCHTSERKSCVALSLTNADLTAQVNNKKIQRDSFAKMVGITDCVKKMMFSFEKGGDVAVNKTCPIVKCDTTLKDSCAVATTNDKKQKSVSLNTCSDKLVCPVQGLDIISDKNFNFTCTNVTVIPVTDRYPGEACDDNHKCRSGECKSNKCTGKDHGETCASNLDCLSGHFCNSATLKCDEQVGLGKNCTKSQDCVNFAGCYNNTCTKYIL
jgi:hypothetical protein